MNTWPRVPSTFISRMLKAITKLGPEYFLRPLRYAAKRLCSTAGVASQEWEQQRRPVCENRGQAGHLPSIQEAIALLREQNDRLPVWEGPPVFAVTPLNQVISAAGVRKKTNLCPSLSRCANRGSKRTRALSKVPAS